MMASERHVHDHIRVKDEAFNYVGDEAKNLENVFSTKRVLLLQGSPFIGKTRTCKEVVLRAARIFRDQECETHTFYLDIRTGFTMNDLQKEVIDALRENVQGWSNVQTDKLCVRDLARCFQTLKNGRNRVYIFALDDIDRVTQEERGKVLKFVEELVSETDCVFIVLASRTSINLIRDIHHVEKHHHKPMSHVNAKALLKEASGNLDLDQHADRIVELVCRLPLPIMMAGYQMNKCGFQLPFTPQEFVEVMEDSVSRTLGLENTPTDDQIPGRIKAIVTENYHVLEKLVSSVNDPEAFDVAELCGAMNETPGHVKQLILHVLLKGSVYMVADTGGDGMHNGIHASPLVFAVLKEFFCQMSSKDIFLKGFNEDIIKALDYQEDELLTSRAGALRNAEWDLLKKQRQGCSHEELRILRSNIITAGGNLVKKVTGDETKAMDFCAASNQKVMSLQSGKNASSTTEMHKPGIQESCHPTVLPPGEHSTNPLTFKKSGENMIMEPEACLSPGSSSLGEPPNDENKSGDMLQRELGSGAAGKPNTLREYSSNKQEPNLPTNCKKQQSSNIDSSNTDTSTTPSCAPLPDEQPPVQETVNETQCVNANGHSRNKEISQVTNSEAQKCYDENVVGSSVTAKEYPKATTGSCLKGFKEQPFRSFPSEDVSVVRTLTSVDEKHPLSNTSLQDQDKYASSGPSDIFLENGKESFNPFSSADSDTQCNEKPQFGSLHSTDEHHPWQQSTEDAHSGKTYSELSTSPMTGNYVVWRDKEVERFMEMDSVKKAVECVYDWKSCESGHHDDSRLTSIEDNGLRKQSPILDLPRQSSDFQGETPPRFRQFQSGKQASVESFPSTRTIHPPVMKQEPLFDPRCHGSMRNQIPQYGMDVPSRLLLPPPQMPLMNNPGGIPVVRGPPSQGSYQYAHNVIRPLTTRGFQMQPQGKCGYGQYLNHRQFLPRNYRHQHNQWPLQYHHMPTVPRHPSGFSPSQQYSGLPLDPFLQVRHPQDPRWQEQANWQMSNQQTQTSYHQCQSGNWY